MPLFEYPYVIITLFVLSFLVMGAIGIFFAFHGIKTAKGNEDNDFSKLNKLGKQFESLKKSRHNRCMIYISVSLDTVRSMYSDSKARRIYFDLKPILLNLFASDENSHIAVYDQNNFVALNTWNEDETKETIKKAVDEINKCLLKYEAINIVNVRFGFYPSIATQVTFDEAISRAKQACMLAERDNTDCVRWNINNGKALEQKIKIENNIENQIDNNRFFLEYQPVLDAKTKKIIGAEVLSRLNSENDGVLKPGSFMSAVNSVGLNDKFDYYIFEKNCKWISNNKQQREKYKYTINFSRTTLCDPEFAQRITNIVDKYALSYSSIAIEILEDQNIVGDARNRMIKNLSELKEKGISILLDDFGSGYTGFDDLQNLDINIVKIDKTITHNSNTETGFLILKNVIRTAKEIGFETVCEGIETEEQEKAAIKAGCDMLQGYYYYGPVPVSQLESLFEAEEQL